MTTPSNPSVTCICGDSQCSIQYGFCHCGCGRETRIATANNAAWGHRKGLPVRFLKGHQRAVPLHVEERFPFKIDGEYCTFIKLTRGFISIVSIGDYPNLATRKWQATKSRQTYYAVRTTMQGGKRHVQMHAEILGDRYSGFGDHKDRNGLDNWRGNLRVSTIQQNSFNRSITTNNSSGYKGVSWFSKTRKWRAVIRVNGVLISLGLFKLAEDAARAYDRAARKYFGEFAFLNFPITLPQPIQGGLNAS
jgi:hypothetical protein